MKIILSVIKIILQDLLIIMTKYTKLKVIIHIRNLDIELSQLINPNF